MLYSCRNSKGQTALHLALKYGYTDVAELLLEKVNPALNCLHHKAELNPTGGRRLRGSCCRAL